MWPISIIEIYIYDLPHKLEYNIFEAFHLAPCSTYHLIFFESTHLIVRLMSKIFDISLWWVSLSLFGHHTIFFFLSLSLFPSQILVCATSFAAQYLFSFGNLHLVSSFSKKINKIKSGKIYRHKFMHVSRSTKPFTNHSCQGWRSIYSSHKDFKISPIMI